ncbi:uncharacterized protein CTRU02_206604 [Colletotrichum truncatum]|uniref:Uncharacterized protein n=1 Tax=Colletotrichum truncatum TaxID=5467 RepID=A0ACC3Z7E3_COLTU
MREDYVSIDQILKANPGSVNETNHLGQSPIHIAVLMGNVDILRSVLTYSDATILNARDKGDLRPIDYATCESMHTSCKNKKLKKSELCNGCAILDVVLGAGCALYPTSLNLALGVGDWQRKSPSIIVQQKVIREVSIRRQGLAKLAKDVLSQQEMDFLDLAEARMLDRNAGLVQHHLQMRSCTVPESLKVWDESEEAKPDAKSIYAFISNRDSAEFAWRLGFDDIGNDSDIINQVNRAVQDIGVPQTLGVAVQMAQYITWWLGKVHDIPLLSQSSKPMIRGERRWGGLSHDEIEEIQKEDEELLELMEDLVADFEERCKCNARLIPFLKDHWAPRMRSVIEGFKANKIVELQAAKEIGVRWEHEDSEDEDEDKNRKFDKKDFAYWMERLDEIAPEPDIMLPPGVRF